MNSLLKIRIIVLLFCGFATWTGAQQQETAAKEIIIPGIYQMPEVSQQAVGKTAGVKSAVREDLHKFMGYEVLPARYLSLPFDVFINNNFNGFFTDVGFLLLLLIPILFLLPAGKEAESEAGKYSPLINGAVMILLALLLVISVSSAYMNSNKLVTPEQSIQHLAGVTGSGAALSGINKSITGIALKLYQPIHTFFNQVSGPTDKITYPLLLLLLVLITFLVGARFKQHSKVVKGLVVLQMMYFFLWWILGSGGAWYGMLLFCIPYVFVLKGIRRKTESSGFTLLDFRSYSLLGFCILWVTMAVVFRSVNYNPISEENGKYIYIPPILEYQAGKMDERKLNSYCFPQHHNVADIINREDKSLVYRVGTSVNYFINKNDRRVYGDTFLDSFDSLVKRFKNKEKIMQILKANGYRYILVDLNLGSADYTPDKSLSRKFIQLMNSLYNNPEVELVSTNRKIKLNSTGEVVNAVFENEAVIVDRGHTALFELK